MNWKEKGLSFGVAAVLWLGASAGILWWMDSPRESGIQLAKFFGLSLLNLVALSGFSRKALQVAAGNAQSQTNSALQILIWMSAKFFLLGLIIWSIFRYEFQDKKPLVLGLGTLVIVPLLGGIVDFLRIRVNERLN